MNHLRARLEAPEFAPPKSAIDYAVIIENTGEEAVDAHLQGREPIHDLTVTGKGGRIVWRRSAGQVNQAILRLEHLGPGESLRLAGSWDQRDASGAQVAPGFYTLQAIVPTDSEPLISQDFLLQITD